MKSDNFIEYLVEMFLVGHRTLLLYITLYRFSLIILNYEKGYISSIYDPQILLRGH